MGIPADKVFKEKLKDPKFRKEYKSFEEEFAVARELIKARTIAKMTQAQVAKKMGTSQSAVARLESGKVGSLASLKKYARATGTKIEFRLVADG
jgi:predicted transcriptional regulator